MKKNQIILLIYGLLIFNSCAKKLYIDYQANSSNTGKIILKPTTPTSRTFITINDKLIVDKKIVKSVTINNVPKGNYEIHYAVDNSVYKTKLDTTISVKISKNDEVTKIVEVPPYSVGYWILVGALIILSWSWVLFL